MIQMYGSSAALWILGIVFAGLFGLLASSAFNINTKGLMGIFLFNGLVGFIGYAMRFYLIPRVSTVVFSVLSFFGIISAYLFSWIFANEVPTLTQGLGALAIVIANAALVTKETV
jgi:drug/metabolite transporter (DMT)-like permease